MRNSIYPTPVSTQSSAAASNPQSSRRNQTSKPRTFPRATLASSLFLLSNLCSSNFHFSYFSATIRLRAVTAEPAAKLKRFVQARQHLEINESQQLPLHPPRCLPR